MSNEIKENFSNITKNSVYARKVFLTENVASTANFSCGYDPKNKGNVTKLFFSLQDCNKAFHFCTHKAPKIFKEDIKAIINALNTIKNLTSVYPANNFYICDTFKYYGDDYTIVYTEQEQYGRTTARFFIVEGANLNGSELFSKNKLFCIHSDEDTCDLEEFNLKISNLNYEIIKFVEFLECVYELY